MVLSPRDAYRRNAFLEPLGLYLQTEAGTLRALEFDSAFQRRSLTVNRWLFPGRGPLSADHQ